MTLNELIAMAKENGIDFDSEIDWDFDADDLYSENTELSCSVNNGSLELSFKLENEKDPSAWLKENLKEVEKVLKTFNLEIDSRDSNELDIKVPATFESDFGETVIDRLNELVPEVFFFEENYLDEEDSIWVVLLSVA
jgi:hypothetical protein